MVFEQGKRRRRSNNDSLVGTGTSVVGGGGEGTDQFAKLPDELVVGILSRSVSTLNEAARCSSLLGRRWRYMWQLVDCGVLDFEDYDDITPELFVNRVDQAIGLLRQSEIRLDTLRIGFKLLSMEGAGWRWIQFGLTERVKQLSLSSYLSRHWRNGIPVPLFTPDFLRKQDLSRLEVLQFRGLSDIPQGTLDHIFSNSPSLQRFSINCCTFHDRDAVVRVCCPNNSKLRRLTFRFPEPSHSLSRIEILSAPGLHSLEVSGGPHLPRVEFGDDIAQLEELRFCNEGQGGCDWDTCYFPWSRAQLDKFARRLSYLQYDLTTDELQPLYAYPTEWPQLFEKLVVLDLSIYMMMASKSMLKCTDLLRAAPMLREFAISFVNHELGGYISWKDGAEELPPMTWRHHSLQVLELHGVHLSDDEEGFSDEGLDTRKPQMELAACIIMASPWLNQVLVDTRNLISNASREPHQVDADILEARMELETRLHSHTATSQIHFIYR